MLFFYSFLINTKAHFSSGTFCQIRYLRIKNQQQNNQKKKRQNTKKEAQKNAPNHQPACKLHPTCPAPFTLISQSLSSGHLVRILIGQSGLSHHPCHIFFSPYDDSSIHSTYQSPQVEEGAEPAEGAAVTAEPALEVC